VISIYSHETRFDIDSIFAMFLSDVRQRDENYKNRKFKQYLKRELDDPLEDIDNFSRSEKKKKILEVCKSVQHYAKYYEGEKRSEEQPNREGQRPRLVDRMQGCEFLGVSMYQLCFFGVDNWLQSGDVVELVDGTECVIDFFYEQTGVVNVYMAVVKTVQSIDPLWKKFLVDESKDVYIRTDEKRRASIGELLHRKPRDTVKMSTTSIERGYLKSTNTSSIATTLAYSYLSCSNKKLHLNPWVRWCANYLNPLGVCTLSNFVWLLENKWNPLLIEFVNDGDDFTKEEVTEFEMANRTNKDEAVCTLCEISRRVCSSSPDFSTCEPCYIKCRRLYAIFQELTDVNTVDVAIDKINGLLRSP
jgi:hypothetical protein